MAEKVELLRTASSGATQKFTVSDQILRDITSSGFLPPSVRYIDCLRQLVLLEFPPTTLTLNASEGRHSYTSSPVANVPLPWMVYLYDQVGQLYVYARPAQLRSLQDELYHCHLPNVRAAGEADPFDSACQGNFLAPPNYAHGLIDRCMQVVNGFLMSNFNGGHYLLANKYVPLEAQELIQQQNDLESSAGDVLASFWVNAVEYFTELSKVPLRDLLTWGWQPHKTAEELIQHAAHHDTTITFRNRILKHIQGRD